MQKSFPERETLRPTCHSELSPDTTFLSQKGPRIVKAICPFSNGNVKIAPSLLKLPATETVCGSQVDAENLGGNAKTEGGASKSLKHS